MSGDLIDTTEMYLKTVYELHETGTPPMRARIAERLGHSGPTVSQTVARMERDGLLHLDEERRIRLTDKGWAIATDVMRKHRLAERHLLDVIGLEFALCHEEACRWEHIMSAEVERLIAQSITAPYNDPYGNPIPGLAQLGVSGGASDDEVQGTPQGQGNVKSLLSFAQSAGEGEVILRRIGERAQSDVELLRSLAEHGALPGTRMRARRFGGEVEILVDDRAPLVIPGESAALLTVVAAPAE